MLSRKLNIPHPIFLVIAGLFISLIPGIPTIRINPEFVFLIFLPPILFSAAWKIPWADFWGMRQSVSTLGFGLVFFTSIVIAYLSHALIPGFELALGFMLGGIISPPDAASATSILGRLRIPKSVVNLLEGESLVNDASSLIVFRFALAAVLTHSFSFWEATQSFFIVAGAGLLIGLAIAFLVNTILKYMPTTPNIDACLILIAPYVMYLSAEHWHFSGVLAVVAGGLFLSYRAHDTLTYASRLNLTGIWDIVGFLLNGFIFILIGLQMPSIVKNLTHNTVKEALYYGLIISAAVILIRFFWVYIVTWVRQKIAPTNPKNSFRPSNKEKFLIAWCGMRGVVSLASALSIPFYIAGEKEFPYRNLIMFITFVVIIVTLVGQGLAIPLIIRILKVEDGMNAKKLRVEDFALRTQLASISLKFLETHYANDIKEYEPFQLVRDRYATLVEHAKQHHKMEKLTPVTSENPREEMMKRYDQMLLDIVDARRRALSGFKMDNSFSEELIREKERELDLEEARLRNNQS